MSILGFRRRGTDLAAAVEALRARGTQITGPFQTRKGFLVFSIANRIVKAEELLLLAGSGPLSSERIQAFLEHGTIESEETVSPLRMH